ncbi:GAF and ANTAR domain-containing protein [Actinoplanes rectilineatus]|uniref:ANTAR domain-containing protein n=1 Tax=Actinoplanes rectilineatus TaxID=113571 RepID=UPI00069812D0
MLAEPDGRIRLVASTDETTRQLELFEIDNGNGPCLTSFHSGAITEHPDFTTPGNQWSDFSARAHSDGYRSSHAIPMRLRQQTVGVLNLFSNTPGRLAQADRQISRAFADLTTIALLQHRAITARRTLAEQLQAAFTTRLDIERAKGMLAERFGINTEDAFNRIRNRARNTNRKIADLAREINTGKATDQF